MMPATRAPTLERLVRSDEIRRGRWSTTGLESADTGHDAARRDDGGETGITAAERRAREERWACEWWPPD